jgi:hypothetical protein
VRSQLRHLDITGPGLKWDCADGFQRQCYPLLPAWVKDYPEQVIVTHVPYGSYAICAIPKGTSMGHSVFLALDNSRHQHIYSELLDGYDGDPHHTLSVNPIRNQFWQYSLCNDYRLWQPDELPQWLLGSVKDILHSKLNCLKLEMSRINMTIDSHPCDNILPSSAS